MRARTFAALIVALLFAWPAAAQEQRGSIEGVVKDSSGAVLPGVTVGARSNAGAVLSTTTDSEGVYRFPSVSPGIYEVTATLQSFTPKKQGNVDVGLGQIKKVDVQLALAGLTESVQVTAESPLVDVKQSARQTNISREQIALLPKGRDFTSLVTAAPGANSESKLGGLSIDGASAGENRYIIDGIETTDLQQGISGKNVIADFIEEVQVRSSGYTAEFGGATGGVINVITKSGTNNWNGNLLFNWQGDKLSGGAVPAEGSATDAFATGVRSLRQNPLNTDIAEYITYPEDKINRVEPGFALGGPIVRDRGWFFAAYQPTFMTIERSVDATTASNPRGETNGATRKRQEQYITANATGQMSDGLRGRLAFNNSWRRLKGLLPTLNATDPAGSDFAKTSSFPNYSVSANMDWVASPNLFFGIRGGYFMSDWHDTDVTEVPRLTWTTTNNIDFLDVPASLQRSTGFSSVLSNSKSVKDQQTRVNFQADGTVYAKMGGDHQMKFGVQVDRVGNNVDSGEAAARVTIRWNTPLSGQRGTYGYYSVRSAGPSNLRRGFTTSGNVNTTILGLFLQDAWTINSRLTINAGIRTERESVPYYAPGEVVDGVTLPTFGLEFGFKDKLGPRAGFAYDINGDGRWKAFGSWGVFYDIFKLELPRGSFGGDKWIEYYYTLDTFDWPNLVSSPECPPACQGRLFRTTDFRHISVGTSAIEPDLKPMRQQEATAGIEHQLSDVMSLSVRYVHKQIDRAIEDTQTATLDADGNEIYIIANPGEGLASIGFVGEGGLSVPIPKPKRDYDSVEFAVEKRFARNWYLRSSYLWSRLFGNYSGLTQSDEDGRTSPNVGRLYDFPIMMFQDGGVAAFGPLATDRPHQFKTQFIYQFPMGTSVGVNQYVASGLPVSREIGAFAGNNFPVQYLGRGSDGRTPTYSQTDFLVQHSFKFAGSRSFQVSFNVLNLFNQDTSVGKFSTYHKTNGPNPDQELFYRGQQTFADLIVSQNIVKDPRFLMDNRFQAPILARFGLKFLF